MVVAFFFGVTCGTTGFESREEVEAAFEVEPAEAVARSKGFGEGLPVDRLNDIVSLAKARGDRFLAGVGHAGDGWWQEDSK